jgi:hypothetical protein
MSDTKVTKPSLSSLAIEFLAAKGRKNRKAGTATTEEIATAIGYPLKQTYDRLYWLAKRESRLLMIGSGKAAVWRSMPKARKAKAEPAAEAPAPEAEATVEA